MTSESVWDSFTFIFPAGLPKKVFSMMQIDRWRFQMTGRCNRVSAAVTKGSLLLLALSASLSGRTAPGQLNSNTGTVTLNAALAESISVSASPTTVTFTLVPGGTALASSPIAITTTWILSSSRGAVYLDGSFGTATAALTGNSVPPVSIPTAEVYGLMSTGLPTIFSPFTINTPLGVISAGLPLFIQLLNSSNVNSSRTDNLTLEINLLLQPQLPSATYTGSLLLQAQAL